jgi:DNA-binding NarL/FixJ family response regulator
VIQMSKGVTPLPIPNRCGTSATYCPSPVSGQGNSETEALVNLAEGSGSVKDRTPIVEHIPAAPTVFYIDKQRLGRDCLSKQLADHLPEWAIESASSIQDLQRNDIRRRQTSLVVLNTHGASVDSAEVANEMAMIAETAPGLPLVILSDLDDATQVLLATRLGARGYLPASLPLPQAIGAIRLVGAGGTYIPTCILLASSLRQPAASRRPMDGRGNPIEFSPRQQQVLRLLQRGKQNKIIAHELGMCESTVKVHIRHIMRKLNARNRTQVVLLTSSATNGYTAACAA